MADRFAPGVTEKIGYYVYLLIDPRDGATFYVGKGVGDRCFAHLTAARVSSKDQAGDYLKLERIRAIEAAGGDLRIEVLRHGLDEATAFHVEAAAIDLLGLDDLANAVAGHDASRWSVAHINAIYGAKPVVIDPAHRVILIRAPRQYYPTVSDEDLYQVARKWWRVDRRWTDPANRRSPQFAFLVAAGVVRAVYRITGWEEPDDATIAEDPVRKGRRAFTGIRDLGMEDQYLFGDVTAYLVTGGQNPIGYANAAWRGTP